VFEKYYCLSTTGLYHFSIKYHRANNRMSVT
jgi:hypothetical protein